MGHIAIVGKTCYFAEFLSRSLLARRGMIMPNAVNTTGVMIFNAIVNISVEYIPSMQHIAVKRKHQAPKNFATA